MRSTHFRNWNRWSIPIPNPGFFFLFISDADKLKKISENKMILITISSVVGVVVIIAIILLIGELHHFILYTSMFSSTKYHHNTASCLVSTCKVNDLWVIFSMCRLLINEQTIKKLQYVISVTLDVYIG